MATGERAAIELMLDRIRDDRQKSFGQEGKRVVGETTTGPDPLEDPEKLMELMRSKKYWQDQKLRKSVWDKALAK